MNATRPKKKPSKKRNKVIARERKEQLLKTLNEAVRAARSTKPVKAATTPKTVKTVKEPKVKSTKAEV